MAVARYRGYSHDLSFWFTTIGLIELLLRSPDLGRDHPTAAMQNPLAADRTSWGRKGGRCCGRPLLWAAEGTLATLRCLVDFWPRAPRDLNPRPSGKTLTVCEYHWPWVLLVGKMRHLRLSVRRTPNQIATQTAIVYNWILQPPRILNFRFCPRPPPAPQISMLGEIATPQLIRMVLPQH